MSSKKKPETNLPEIDVSVPVPSVKSQPPQFLDREEILRGGSRKFRVATVGESGTAVRFRPLSYTMVSSFFQKQSETGEDSADKTELLNLMLEICEDHLVDENGNRLFSRGDLGETPFDFINSTALAIVQGSVSGGESEGEASTGARTSGQPIVSVEN